LLEASTTTTIVTEVASTTIESPKKEFISSAPTIDQSKVIKEINSGNLKIILVLLSFLVLTSFALISYEIYSTFDRKRRYFGCGDDDVNDNYILLGDVKQTNNHEYEYRPKNEFPNIRDI
jgi:hypothetical protein